MRYAPLPLDTPPATILTAGPSISARETTYALQAVRNGWNARWNEYLSSFEDAFACFVGVRSALATSSGTGALHLALAALRIGPGDEVIVPDLTWVASANAVAYTGATPVFADVDPVSWCLDPASFEGHITPRTRAVMPVHLYGHPARMDAILEIARRHGLYVVEDAAPAVGAEFEGRRVGSFGHFGAFSFQGAKLVVTGEGGMLVSDDETLMARARALWDQGRAPGGAFWIDDIGFKYKMSNLQAAVGLGQLERVEQMIEAKRGIVEWYRQGLEGVAGIRLHDEAPWARSIHWMTSILLEDEGLDRDGVMRALRARQVDTRPVFPAISQYPMWQPRPTVQPVARHIGARGLNLPSGVCLKRLEVDYVCRMLREVLERGTA